MEELKIKYLILDVDGTLTDGIVYIGNEGELSKGFYVRDGVGIQKAMKAGIVPIILTSRKSEIVRNRCAELGIEQIYQGVPDKAEFLRNYLKNRNIDFESVAYIADDENDLEAISMAGLSGCPSDAVRKIKNISNFVSDYKGGRGAVREFCEYIIEKNLQNDR